MARRKDVISFDYDYDRHYKNVLSTCGGDRTGG